MSGNELNNDQFKKLSTKVRVSYGFGDTACNIVYGMISALLVLFYTDYAGVPVATVGLVMLISRIFDGTSDAIMGVIVTKTKSKWGKARPWILWMAIPYCISAVALFTVPQTTETMQFWYIFITYNVTTTICYTAINVPYGTLSAYMTRSSHERDMLSIFRMSMAPIGRIIAVTLTQPVVKLLGDDQAAWVKAMLIWVVIAFVMLIICFVNCKEMESGDDDSNKDTKVGIGTALKTLLTNQYFWACLILWTVTCVHGTIVGTALPYYCKYIFGNDTWMYSVLYLAETLTLVIGAMFCPMLLKKFGKRQISLIGAIVAVIAQALFIINTQSFEWALATSILRALGEAPLTAIVFGMLGDAVEFGQWKSHIRQTSLIFAGGALGFKLGTGITSALLSNLLSGAGYVSSSGAGVTQPASALAMIQNIYIWGPILVWIIAVVVLALYKLDKKYPAIMKELAERETRGEL